MKHYYRLPSNLRISISIDKVFAIVSRVGSSDVSTQGPTGPLGDGVDREGFDNWFRNSDNADLLTNDGSATVVVFGVWEPTDNMNKRFKVFAIVHYDDWRYKEKDGMAYFAAIAGQREHIEMKRTMGDLGFRHFDDIVFM